MSLLVVGVAGIFPPIRVVDDEWVPALEAGEDVFDGGASSHGHHVRNFVWRRRRPAVVGRRAFVSSHQSDIEATSLLDRSSLGGLFP